MAGPWYGWLQGPTGCCLYRERGGKERGAVAALSRPQLPRGVCGPRRVGSESGVADWPLVWLPGALGDLPAFRQDMPGPAQMTFVVGGGWAPVPGRAREASLESRNPREQGRALQRGMRGPRGGRQWGGC